MAAAAGDKTAQRKVITKVLSCRSLHRAVQTILIALPNFETDQRFMLAGVQRDAPFRHIEITGIERPAQQVLDPLDVNLAASIFGGMQAER